jgi:hypothetical protein
MSSQFQIVFVFVFIVIIYFIAILFGTKGTQKLFSGILVLFASLLILSVFLGQNSLTESFGNLFPAQKLSDLNTDNYEFSPYKNISTSSDIDMTRQELSDESVTESGKIDNSDVIDMVITRGTSLFQPDGKGFTPLRGSEDNTFEKRGFSLFNIPLTGSQDVDELLARKQTQRGAINKRALDGQVRATRNLFNRYFQEELNENEQRVWYSSEAQNLETDWNPY